MGILKQEPWKKFNIIIELPSGNSLHVVEKGRTEYEALDRAHTKRIDVQKDRSMYMLSTGL